MTHTLTQTARRVKQRKSALRRAGISYTRFAKFAGVSHSMVWKYMNGVRESDKCDLAFSQVTGNGRRS